MDVFYNLINQIASLSENETDEFLDNYDKFLEVMLSNQELLNDIKKEMKLQNMNRNDIVQEKEALLVSIDRTIKEVTMTEKQKELFKKLNDIVHEIYDKILEQGIRECINVPIELCHEDAKVPTYAHPYDAGFDFYLIEDINIKPGETKIVRTGIKMAIPSGYELQIRPRSGTSLKTSLRIANAPGTIDCGYPDEIGILAWNTGTKDLNFKKGERIAQGVFAEPPKGEFQVVTDLQQVVGANRKGGFGSSGQ